MGSKRIECPHCGVTTFHGAWYSLAYESMDAYLSEQELRPDHTLLGLKIPLTPEQDTALTPEQIELNYLKELADDCKKLHDGDADSGDENVFMAKYKILYKACKDLGRYVEEENPD